MGELTTWLGDVAVFENRQPVTAAKFINNCSLFILLLGVIRRLELKPNSEQKVENIFVAPRHIAKPPVSGWQSLVNGLPNPQCLLFWQFVASNFEELSQRHKVVLQARLLLLLLCLCLRLSLLLLK